tara:strand:+ start:253 stop:465 length:213 start_codon:yes stop_codon:yes gene_type:complete
VYFDNTYATNAIYDFNVVNKMSMLAFYKSTYDEIEKLIENHVNECRRNIPWTGENKVVVDKIIKVFKRTT